jgi:hypothetical protein
LGKVRTLQQSFSKVFRGHAGEGNFYTRNRIERAHDGLWARGAAVGNTVIGYKRRPTLPPTETEPAKGPFYDEIDEEKAAEAPHWQVRVRLER